MPKLTVSFADSCRNRRAKAAASRIDGRGVGNSTLTLTAPMEQGVIGATVRPQCRPEVILHTSIAMKFPFHLVAFRTAAAAVASNRRAAFATPPARQVRETLDQKRDIRIQAFCGYRSTPPSSASGFPRALCPFVCILPIAQKPKLQAKGLFQPRQIRRWTDTENNGAAAALADNRRDT